MALVAAAGATRHSKRSSETAAPAPRGGACWPLYLEPAGFWFPCSMIPPLRMLLLHLLGDARGVPLEVVVACSCECAESSMSSMEVHHPWSSLSTRCCEVVVELILMRYELLWHAFAAFGRAPSVRAHASSSASSSC